MSSALPSLREDSPAAFQTPNGARRVPAHLKICFISETLHAGVGRHIVDTICALSQRGHEIHLLYSPIRLEPQFLATIQQQQNVHCEAVTMPKAIGQGDFSAFSRIKQYVQNNGPFDIIHGHSSKAGGYARILRLSCPGAIVYTPHAFSTLSPLTGMTKRITYGAIEVALALLTDGIICTSRAERDHARRLGIAASRLTIIAHGIDANCLSRRETARARLEITPERIVVGFAGRMDDQKAPERLVEAVQELAPHLPNLTLVMIGDGPKRRTLEASLQRTGLGDRAIWLGAVDARQYMPAFDIFALPSLYEGFAYVLIEALYAGLAIVTTPVGGTAESVIPGVNGIVVQHGAGEDMVTAIRQLATDPALRRRMGQASRELAEQFSIPRMTESIEGFYRKVLAGRYSSANAASSVPTGFAND